MIVIDASLAVKWFIDEPLSDEAETLLQEQSGAIAVPALFLSEVCGALVRRANLTPALRPAVDESMARFEAMLAGDAIVVKDMDVADVVAAGQLALDLGHPIKDCLYLQLAMTMDCPLITCDARFAAKAREVWAGVRVLQ